MKKLFSLVTLSLFSLSFLAQGSPEGENDNSQEVDTMRISLGDDSSLIIVSDGEGVDVEFEDHRDSLKRAEDERDVDFTYWAGVDLGFTSIMMPSDLEDEQSWFDIQESNSVSFSINPLETKIPIIKHYLGINTGLGLTWQDYALSDTINLVQPNDSIIGVSSSPIKYEKNKLKTGYIKIPLLLEINTSKHKEKNFHIAAGLIGGWNYRSVLKQKFKIDGDKTKSKTRGDYNINPFSLELAARVGYGNLSLFATLSTTELFEPGKGPEVYPFTVGVSLLAFD